MPDIQLFIFGWDRSFLSVAWPAWVQRVFRLLRVSVSYSAHRDLHCRELTESVSPFFFFFFFLFCVQFIWILPVTNTLLDPGFLEVLHKKILSLSLFLI